jgi:hypothetical protein
MTIRIVSPGHLTSLFAALAIVAGAAPGVAQSPGIGIGVGDRVTVGTGMGWVDATVLGADGHVFRVRFAGGPEVFKRYPDQLRRKGPLTAYDRENGVYDLTDRIQVRYEGAWVDSRIITIMGMEYQVALPGDLIAWAKPDQMRFVGPAETPAARKAGEPPRAGMTSCSGKIEGRYALTSAGPLTITFRSGKATIRAPGMDPETVDCWIDSDGILLAGEGEDPMELLVNDDGTLQSPLGEMSKKAR